MVEFIVVSCLVLLLILGLTVGRKNQQEAQTFTDFFLGKRNFSTLIILSTIFAGMVSGSSIINLNTSIFSNGYFYLFRFSGVFIAHLTVGLWLAKKMGPYLEDCLSPGDILEKMYGREAKIIMGFTNLFQSILMIGAQIIAISFMCDYFFHIPPIFSALGALLFTLLYSLRGGIKALVMSNIVQFIFLIIILPILCCNILSHVGGFKGLLLSLRDNSYKHQQLFDPYKDIAAFIFYALPAIFPLALQRMLMAKDVHQIKKTFICNSFMQLIFMLCLVLIGLYASIVVPQTNANGVLFALINTILPLGKGLIIFALLAILMSTINAYLNIAAVAITHDLFIPLCKKELNDAEKLKTAKLLLIGVAIFAALLAIYGKTIFSTMALASFINDSVLLVAYVLGFLGIQPSKKGFLKSISFSIAGLFIALYVFNIYKIYASLLAMIPITLGLLVSHYINKPKTIKFYNEPLQNKKKPKLFDCSVKRIEHCNVFASIAIINSVYPFFLIIPSFNLVKMPFFLIYPLISIISFFILFKEIWPSNLLKYFPVVWHTLLTLSLPTLAFLMYFQSNFHSIWLIDIIVITVLLLITTRKNMVFITGISGALLAVFITALIGINFSEYVVNIGEICLIAHLISSIICLLFFKEQENDMYRSVSSKITHEAARSLSGMGMSAFFLEERMLKLVHVYDLARRNNLLSEELLSTEELVQLKELPFHLNGMKQRTSETLHCLLHKIDKELESKKQLETVDIISLAKEAILYPSFSLEQRKKIILNTSHNFFLSAVSSEIVHVIINLIENALCAIKDKPNGQIELWAGDASLFIKDNGIGMDRKTLYQIFDEGFSTKGTSGQGLAFCKKIMEEHAGKIRCTSEKDSYTQFELRFNDTNK